MWTEQGVHQCVEPPQHQGQSTETTAPAPPGQVRPFGRCLCCHVSTGQLLRVVLHLPRWVKVTVSRGSLSMDGSGAVVKMQDSQLWGPVFKSSCCCFDAWAILFAPHCLNSLRQTSTWLYRQWGIYMNE